MQVFQVDEGHQEQWDSFVAQRPHFTLMQSYQWGEFKENLGWKAIRLAAQQQGHITGVTQLLMKSDPLGLFSVGYVPRGPLVDWKDTATTTALLYALHSEAQRHRAIFTKIEPPLLNTPEAHGRLRQYGFRASSYTNQPRATIVIDLTAGLDEMLASMQQKTRYNIRYAGRKGVTVREGRYEDLEAFYRLLKITGARNEFPIRSWDYYLQVWHTLIEKNLARLLLAEYQGRVIAGIIVAVFGDRAAYLYGASSDEYRNVMPNHLLQWEAMNWARRLGCVSYDLWGIPDQVGQVVYEGKALPKAERTDGLWGVYRFKSGFSKNIVFHTGAYDYVYSPLLYVFITNKLLNGGRLDRIAVWMDSLRGA